MFGKKKERKEATAKSEKKPIRVSWDTIHDFLEAYAAFEVAVTALDQFDLGDEEEETEMCEYLKGFTLGGLSLGENGLESARDQLYGGMMLIEWVLMKMGFEKIDAPVHFHGMPGRSIEFRYKGKTGREEA